MDDPEGISVRRGSTLRPSLPPVTGETSAIGRVSAFFKTAAAKIRPPTRHTNPVNCSVMGGDDTSVLGFTDSITGGSPDVDPHELYPIETERNEGRLSKFWNKGQSNKK